jgi:Domain of unknown function (DUF4166)
VNLLSLYEQVLGENYARLPAAVQRFHRLSGHTVMHGWVETHTPDSWLARGLALCLGAPRSTSSGPLRFELQASPNTETWTRHFPTRTMSSRMRLVDGQVEERLGAARLTFNLTASKKHLNMELVKMRFFGVPCPSGLLPQVVAQETGTADQFHFHVSAALPWIGVIASYRGHLDLTRPSAAPPTQSA